MRKVAILLGILAAQAVAAHAGELEVCRPDYVDKRLNREALVAPAGITFEDWGAEKDGAAEALKTRWELRLVTTGLLRFKPGQRCATVSASIAHGSARRAVSPKDHRHFEPGGMLNPQGGDFAPYPPIWDRISQMTARAASQIR